MTRHNRILKGHLTQTLEKAARALRAGEVVAFPTETVYGLGANALDADAVCKIFEVKKRPKFNPLIVHVARPGQARKLWKKVPKLAEMLMERFWPGPLTIVLPRSRRVPDIVTAGLPTVAVRMPDHKIARRLLERFGGPVAAPSANRFGRTSATTAAAVREEFADQVKVIVDGGRCAVGVESTVVKIESDRCILLRPGAVTAEQLSTVCPAVIMKNPILTGSSGRHSPGLLAFHYAPRTPMILADPFSKIFSERIHRAKKVFRKRHGRAMKVGLLWFGAATACPDFACVCALSPDRCLHEAASNLFQQMRRIDKMKLDGIVAAPVPEEGIGAAIMDRLKKASGGKVDPDLFLEERQTA